MADLEPTVPARIGTRGNALRRGALAVLLTVAALAAGPAASAVTAPAAPVIVTGMDLHDGTVVTSGTTLYMLGTQYGCGFYWGKTSPWCGFGSASATTLSPTWSAPRLLFSPGTKIEATGWTSDNGRTWSAMCGAGRRWLLQPAHGEGPGRPVAAVVQRHRR